MKSLPIEAKNYYLNHHDAINYLHNTIVLHRGKLGQIQIRGEEDDLIAILVEPYTGTTIETVPIDELEIDCPEIGYVNYNEGPESPNRVYYLSRMVGKRFRHGLCDSNVQTEDIDGEVQRGLSILHHYSFKDSVYNHFPSVAEVLEKFQTQRYASYAVSKQVALRKLRPGIIIVLYRNNQIGYILPKALKTVIIPDSKNAWVVEKHLFDFNWEIKKE